MVQCWNFGCTVDIKRGENWTPLNKIWVNTSNDMPHDLKQCYKDSMIRQGKWHNYSPKPEYIPPIIEYPNLWLWPARFKEELDHLRRNQ